MEKLVCALLVCNERFNQISGEEYLNFDCFGEASNVALEMEMESKGNSIQVLEETKHSGERFGSQYTVTFGASGHGFFVVGLEEWWCFGNAHRRSDNSRKIGGEVSSKMFYARIRPSARNTDPIHLPTNFFPA